MEFLNAKNLKSIFPVSLKVSLAVLCVIPNQLRTVNIVETNSLL